ncbi:hypothetical protein Pse7367_1115 [Thalassoporum mexicanum PCC 7367]|uniref:hypothetical protein n=1 Tax=Thalassoporum mexicanum TaxID=3457544 RepID=UPI00029FF6E5|nr:hypothetical protein [Pseudanabaena sp. PCC 7367]AFY69412.1 hypothetical protein Pse7367_1115 [Pseudanabaena sp. PCC 7367]
MAATKLSVKDKKEILRLYCDTDASTTSLAKQYGVSSSTVLRLLQELMSPEEYRQVVSQKQTKGKKRTKSKSRSTAAKPAKPIPAEAETKSKAKPSKAKGTKGKDVDQDQNGEQLNLIEAEQDTPSKPAKSNRRRRSNSADRSSTGNKEQSKEADSPVKLVEPDDEAGDRGQIQSSANLDQENIDDEIAEDLASELAIDDLVGDEFGDEDDLDDDDEDEDEDDLDDDEPEDSEEITRPTTKTRDQIAILPLDAAELPNTLYVVIDRAAEIITKPLKDFRELGQIPTEELHLATMPVFNNHRVARRFSNRNQKIIKFSGGLLHAAQQKLAEKGIMRLLFDGQVYAL